VYHSTAVDSRDDLKHPQEDAEEEVHMGTVTQIELRMLLAPLPQRTVQPVMADKMDNNLSL
jgi:hypothetical protein